MTSPLTVDPEPKTPRDWAVHFNSIASTKEILFRHQLLCLNHFFAETIRPWTLNRHPTPCHCNSNLQNNPTSHSNQRVNPTSHQGISQGTYLVKTRRSGACDHSAASLPTEFEHYSSDQSASGTGTEDHTELEL